MKREVLLKAIIITGKEHGNRLGSQKYRDDGSYSLLAALFDRFSIKGLIVDHLAKPEWVRPV